jgi:hypothetical protein
MLMTEIVICSLDLCSELQLPLEATQDVPQGPIGQQAQVYSRRNRIRGKKPGGVNWTGPDKGNGDLN